MSKRFHRRQIWALLTTLVLAFGCGESTSPSSGPMHTFPDPPRTVFGGARPVPLQVPRSYDAGRPTPLLVVLHGYGFNGSVQAQYLRLTPLVESQGFLMAAPDGTVDSTGSRFWNTTDDCCSAVCSSVDDIGYIRGLLADIRHDYNVDPKRISKLPGNETSIKRYNGCALSTGVELWTIHGGSHVPTLSPDFAPRVWQWLSDHPKV